jgi:hypothetical protein
MKKTILAILILAAAVSAQQKSTKTYKMYSLSDNEVIVTCKDGNPAVKKLTGNSLVISCNQQ